MSDQERGRYPRCSRVRNGKQCGGTLLPFSDYGRDTSNLQNKAWACSDENCGFAMSVDNGVVSYDHVERERAKHRATAAAKGPR